jgi:hypothetical protein
MFTRTEGEDAEDTEAQADEARDDADEQRIHIPSLRSGVTASGQIAGRSSPVQLTFTFRTCTIHGLLTL